MIAFVLVPLLMTPAQAAGRPELEASIEQLPSCPHRGQGPMECTA